MADDGRVEEQFRIVARDDVESLSALDPVVAFVTQQVVPAGTAQDEVVALATEGLARVLTDQQRVPPLAAEQQVDAPGRRDDRRCPRSPRRKLSPNVSSMMSSPSPPKTWSAPAPPFR